MNNQTEAQKIAKYMNNEAEICREFGSTHYIQVTRGFSLSNDNRVYNVDEYDFVQGKDETIEAAIERLLNEWNPENANEAAPAAPVTNATPAMPATPAKSTKSVKSAEEIAYDALIQKDIDRTNQLIAADGDHTAALIAAQGEETARMIELEGVLTAAEAAEEYGLTESSVRKAISRGQIRARKSAGVWLVRRADAEKRWAKKS